MSVRLQILALHRILPHGQYFIPPMAFSEAVFSELIKKLSRSFHIMRLDQAVYAIQNKNELTHGLLALTFDDGYLDNFEAARPVLLKYGIPATFYVPTKPIDNGSAYWWDHLHHVVQHYRNDFKSWLSSKTSLHVPASDLPLHAYCRNLVQQLNSQPESIRSAFLQAMQQELGPYQGERLLMNWQEVRQLSQEGFEIGSHTMSHAPLTDLPDDQARKEIQQSKQVLAARIGSEVHGFCYPRGQFLNDHARMVQDSGYSYAVTTRFGSNNSQTDPFCLARRNIADYQGIRSYFPVAMHMLELTGWLDPILKSRRS